MNALLSFVEVPRPVGSRGHKRGIDETQVPEAPLESSAATLASLDDWLAGTQFEAARPTMQPASSQVNGADLGLQDPSLWTASKLRATGAPNALFAALGFGASVDEHFLPLDDWNADSGGSYDAQSDLARLFGSSMGSGA